MRRHSTKPNPSVAPNRRSTSYAASSTTNRTCAKELTKLPIPFGRDRFAIICEPLGRKLPNPDAPWDSVGRVARPHATTGTLAGNGSDITLEVASIVFEHLRNSSTKAKVELGFKTDNLRTMVEGSLNWLKQKGLHSSSRGPRARRTAPRQLAA